MNRSTYHHSHTALSFAGKQVFTVVAHLKPRKASVAEWINFILLYGLGFALAAAVHHTAEADRSGPPIGLTRQLLPRPAGMTSGGPSLFVFLSFCFVLVTIHAATLPNADGAVNW